MLLASVMRNIKSSKEVKTAVKVEKKAKLKAYALECNATLLPSESINTAMQPCSSEILVFS